MLLAPILFVVLLIAGYKLDQLDGRNVWIYLGCGLGSVVVATVVSLIGKQPSWLFYGSIIGFVVLDLVLLFVVFGEFLGDIKG